MGPTAPSRRPQLGIVTGVDVRIAAYGVIVRDGELLLSHWNEDGRTGWTLPGGGLEDYETAEDAAVREIREETGYDAELVTLLGIDSWYIKPEDRWTPTDGPSTTCGSSMSPASSAGC